MGSLHSITDGDRSLLPKVVDESKQVGEKSSAAHDQIYKMDGGLIKDRFFGDNGGIGKMHDLGDLKKLFQTPEATPEDISKAGKKLDDSISPVAPKDMQQDMKNIHAGVLSGDTAKVAEAIKDIQAKHPEMLKDAIKEMNRQFKENNAGVEMALTGDGKVLLYKNDPLDMGDNKSALQIDPKDGSVSARPIKVRDDGTVVLEPGEIVNADVDKIAKGIGNTATSNINGDGFNGIITETPHRLPDFPIKPDYPEFPMPHHPWTEKPIEIKPLFDPINPKFKSIQPEFKIMDAVGK
ncbi:MAG: hypothetical protein P4L53_27745 [Candidatus Obscuribacterales bacterium]|nr:hypothetical protein [Candidatus Obscuribacterales bacterium]